MADEADQYERAWLLLADIYIQSGKFDLAQVGLLLSNCVTESSLFLAAFAQCKFVCESCVEALLMVGLVWSGAGCLEKQQYERLSAANHTAHDP